METGWEQESTSEEGARGERIKRLILAAVSRCSTCHRSFSLADFAVIGHREHLWMVSVVCEGCRNQGFVTAVVEGRHFEPAQQPRKLLSDLSPAERLRFAAATPVAADDLLDLHVFLDGFDGDFARLFDGERGKT